MPSRHLILCRPLLLLPPIPPSIRVFSNESALRMRWPKYWSFSFSIIPSKEIPGLISLLLGSTFFLSYLRTKIQFLLFLMLPNMRSLAVLQTAKWNVNQSLSTNKYIKPFTQYFKLRIYPQKYTKTQNIHCSIVFNFKKLETT